MFLGQILLSQEVYEKVDSIKGIIISYLDERPYDTVNYIGDWSWDIYYESTDTVVLLQLTGKEDIWPIYGAAIWEEDKLSKPIVKDTTVIVNNISTNIRYSKMDYLRDEFNTNSKEYISMVKEENIYKLIGLMASLIYGLIGIIPFFIKYSTMDYRSVLLELVIIISICLALYFALPKVLSLIFNSQYNIIKALL